MTDMMDLYGVGDHGGGPTRAMLDEGFHWAAPDPASVTANGGAPVTPNYEFGTAQSWFSADEKNIAPDSPVWNYQSISKGYSAPAAVAGKTAIPTWNSELYFEYHRGVYTTQANHKHNMRTAEEEMLNAEKFSSIAWLYGAKYPADELTEDWKKVLFNQFHDLAAGSGIAVIYKDAQKDYDWVRMSTDGISDGALRTVAERIDSVTGNKHPERQPVVVFNPLGWERSGQVTLTVEMPSTTSGIAVRELTKPRQTIYLQARKTVSPNSAEISFAAEDIPPFGYKVYQLLMNGEVPSPFLMPKDRSASPTMIQNGVLRVAVDSSTGCITSFYDKESNVETLAPKSCGNQLQFFGDTPRQYDAWNVDPGTLDVPPMTIDKADSVEMVDDGAFRVTRHWQNSKFVQTVRLEGDIIDIDNDIDWHEKHVLLKAAFPLAVTSDFATYEIPYGTIERPTRGTTPSRRRSLRFRRCAGLIFPAQGLTERSTD